MTRHPSCLFDVDEHTGCFGGAKAYFEGPSAPARVDGVLIGYPGLDHVVTGGRGVLRARGRAGFRSVRARPRPRRAGNAGGADSGKVLLHR